MLFQQETKRNKLANLFDKESRFGVIDCRVDGSRHPPHVLRSTGHRHGYVTIQFKLCMFHKIGTVAFAFCVFQHPFNVEFGNIEV